MTEVLLFHHAQGLTPGVRAFADTLRAAGHIVHTPDLFDGRTFASIEEGLAYIGGIGFDDMRRARRAHSRRAALRPRLRRLLVRCAARPEVGADTSWCARGAAFLLLPPDQRAMGLRTVAGRCSRTNPRHGQRSRFRRPRRYRRRTRDRGEGQGCAAVPVRRKSALLRRQFAAVIRRGGHRNCLPDGCSNFWIVSELERTISFVRSSALRQSITSNRP